MAARSIGSLTIVLGLVAIPTKLYTATSTKAISLNRLHKPPCGAKISQQQVCPLHKTVLEADDLVNGYEHTPGQFVLFSAEEMKGLDLAADTGRLRITEVVPLATVDPTYLAKTTYLGPDKGSDRAYRLLAAKLTERSAVGVGQIGGGRRDELVIVRAHEGGLVLHECFYADEVRPFAETEAAKDAATALSRTETALAGRLLDALEEPAFSAERFTNGAAERFAAAVQRKVDGKEVVPAPPAPGAVIVHLEEALRMSVAELTPKPRKKTAAPAPARQRAARAS